MTTKYIFVYIAKKVNPLIKMNEKNEKPVSLRLGQLRKPLELIAKRKDRSVHWLLLDILKKNPEVKEELSKSNSKE